MRFDTKRRRYIDSSGHVIPSSEVRKEVINYITNEQSRAQREAEKLVKGSISLSTFFQFMRSRVEAWHLVAGSIAYGGKSQLDAERRARIAAKVRSEKTFLTGFQDEVERSFQAARQIAAQVAESITVQPVKALSRKLAGSLKNKVEKRVTEALLIATPSDVNTVVRKAVAEALEDDDLIAEMVSVDEGLAAKLIGGTIVSRAGLYADAIYATFQNNVAAREFDSGVTLGRRICVSDEDSCDECDEAATEEFVPLDDLAEIGSLACGSRCRCEFEFSLEGVEFATSDVFSAEIGGQDAYGGSVTIQ